MGPIWRLLSRTTRLRLGWASGASVLLPWLAGEFAKTWFQPGLAADPLRASMFIDILVVAVAVFALTMVLTVAVGCIVTAVMKGPRHLGDPFPSDRA
jgi:hypothetical protein